MELVITLKQARGKIQEAYRKINTKESHREPLAEAEKAVKLAKARLSTYLKSKVINPDMGSFYHTTLWERLDSVQEAIWDFQNGHGWDCLTRAVEQLDEVIEYIVNAEVINA